MKKKFLLIISLIMVIVLCASCSSGSNNASSSPAEKYDQTDDDEYSEIGALSDVDSTEGDSSDTTEAGSEGEGEKNQAKKKGQKLVYSSTITVETKKYDNALSSLRKSINKYDGIIESENENKDSVVWGSGDQAEIGERRNQLTIRIPTEHYEEFLQGVEELGVVREKTSDVQNITRTYNDTTTRIKALERQEERVLKMMDEAKTIDEMITVEKRLTEIQTELDLYKTRLSGMDMDVAYSTIVLTLKEVEKERPTVKPSFASQFIEAFADSFGRFVTFLQGLVISLVYLLPYFIFIGAITAIVLLIVRKTGKKPGRKKTAKMKGKPVEKPMEKPMTDPVKKDLPQENKEENKEDKKN